MKEALYYEKLEGQRVRCKLCFHECILAEGDEGFCLARRNEAGVLAAETYGELVAAHLDPIEKKPLYHFHPGEEILSVAASGCNLACPFCQNVEISRRHTASEFASPAKLVETAMSSRSKGIAYTYTEPLVWFEYVLDTSKAAHEKGLYNVIVSNGTINEEPLAGLIPHLDAANIDLKGDREFYRKILKGDRDSTIRTIRMLHQAGVHVEVTLLLIPGGNDSEDQVEEEISFIESVDCRIPFHISRYFPHNAYPSPPTPVETMERVYYKAKERLTYVYLGNVMLEHGNDTCCPNCQAVLVERAGYRIKTTGIKDSRCASCGRKVDLVL